MANVRGGGRRTPLLLRLLRLPNDTMFKKCFHLYTRSYIDLKCWCWSFSSTPLCFWRCECDVRTWVCLRLGAGHVKISWFMFVSETLAAWAGTRKATRKARKETANGEGARVSGRRRRRIRTRRAVHCTVAISEGMWPWWCDVALRFWRVLCNVVKIMP